LYGWALTSPLPSSATRKRLCEARKLQPICDN
jgi:hypothetical protein